jgi:hypothetical protein
MEERPGPWEWNPSSPGLGSRSSGIVRVQCYAWDGTLVFTSIVWSGTYCQCVVVVPSDSQDNWDKDEE